MLDQDTALALLTVADEHGATRALVGDRAPLAAIGRGGVLDMTVQLLPRVHAMTAVHRFTDPEYAALTVRIMGRSLRIKPYNGHENVHYFGGAMVTELPAAILRSAREIGQDLAGWRKVLELTAAQVADRADITRGTLRKLEHGDPSVSFHVVLRVARALGILDTLTTALDPLDTDLGRARAGQLERKRIR